MQLPLAPASTIAATAELVVDVQHHRRVVLDGMLKARTSLDIATADFKAMLVPQPHSRNAVSIVEISDPTALDLLLSVTPTDAARVRPGAKVTVSAGQSATGEPLGIGSVLDVAGSVDTTTRSVAVRVEAPTTRRRLRIGETVFGAIAVGTRASAIVVPIEALVPEGEEFKVFVVDANSIAHERDVKVGGRTSTVAEILEGLTAGERVVTTGAYGVADSAKVVAPGDSAKGAAPKEKP